MAWLKVSAKIASMEEEEWKTVPIQQFCDFYEVSSLGKVRSKDRKTVDGRNIKGKPLKHTTNDGGYKVITMANDGFRYSIQIHKLVAITFGIIFRNEHSLDQLVINHMNGNKHDNSVKNLEACTQSENTLHAYRLGLRKTK